MSPTDLAPEAIKQLKEHDLVNTLRDRALELCKAFKVSWIELGQTLHAVEEDKLYHIWGYEKLEDYTVEELGFDQNLARKLIKSYLYVIDEQPEYLKAEYSAVRDTSKIPSLEEINFLRMAKGKKILQAQDQAMLKKQVFEKGQVASALKQELTSLMRERKVVDPDAEREKRSKATLNALIKSLQSFQKDAESAKLVPFELVKEAENLLNKLKENL